VEAQQKVLFPTTTIALVGGKSAPESATETTPKRGNRSALTNRVGDVPGQIDFLHVINGEKRQRYVVLAVIHRPERIIALECECSWDSREVWQPGFANLLETFRLKEG
jgi:hypothetical protein